MAEKEYKCDQCDKVFTHHIALAGHKAVHLTEKEKAEIIAKRGKSKVDANKTSSSISEEEKTTEVQTETVREAAPQKKEDKVEIKIHNVEGELDYVFVRVTGKDTINKSFRIERGQWVTVPREVVNILNDATVETHKYDPDLMVPGKYNKKPTTFTQYPMSVREIGAVH